MVELTDEKIIWLEEESNNFQKYYIKILLLKPLIGH